MILSGHMSLLWVEAAWVANGAIICIKVMSGKVIFGTDKHMILLIYKDEYFE
jgi:hypothetical protein